MSTLTTDDDFRHHDVSSPKKEGSVALCERAFIHKTNGPHHTDCDWLVWCRCENVCVKCESAVPRGWSIRYRLNSHVTDEIAGARMRVCGLDYPGMI